MNIRFFLGLVLACSASAQLVAPNSMGVAMGHVHLTVRDMDANKKFFATLGGTPVQNGPLEMIQFPNFYVLLRQGEPSAGSAGSAVNHFGFQVQKMQDWLPKWQAAGLKMDPIRRPDQVYLRTPDDVRIEILEEPSIAAPIAGHHVHFVTQDLPAMQAWYAKMFGAVPGKRAQFDNDLLPGVDLSFSSSTTPLAPTKGRAFDHLGFEIRNLPAFLAKLEAAGIKLDRPYTKIPNTSIAIAFFTDPWGAYVELTEGLAPASAPSK